MLQRASTTINQSRFNRQLIRTLARDVFGTLSERGSMHLELEKAQRLIPDDAIGYDKEEHDIVARKNAYYYKYEISKHARMGKVGLRKALELFKEMKSVGRLQPTMDNFSPLIYGCAKSGYTQKAFELYQELLKYHPKPSNSIVTCLINSCGESPFQEYGIERLEWFLSHLKIEHCRDLNRIQYNVAIKAFGKLGKLEKASNLVGEMIKKDMFPDIETFNMLLMGCVSHREAGTTLALRIFKRMKQYNISPNVNSYNLLLRCIRDCGIGTQALIEATLRELPALATHEQKLKYKEKGKTIRQKLLNSVEWLPTLEDLETKLSQDVSLDSPPVKLEPVDLLESGQTSIQDYPHSFRPDAMPNLLSDDNFSLYSRINSIDIEKLATSKQRIHLFGGMHGFLEAMEQDKCRPDKKTFCLMLACIPCKKQEELELMRLAKDHQVEIDVPFYNHFLNHICFAKYPKRLEFALELTEEMNREGLRLDIESFEALAYGCDSWQMAQKLMVDTERCGFVISDVMIDRFFLVASRNYNFLYLTSLIYRSMQSNYRPTKDVVQKLDDVRLKAYEAIVDYERGRSDVKPLWLSDQQVQHFERFKMKLPIWLRKVEIREENHPWLQFNVLNESKKRGFKKFVKDMRLLIESKH